MKHGKKSPKQSYSGSGRKSANRMNRAVGVGKGSGKAKKAY